MTAKRKVDINMKLDELTRLGSYDFPGLGRKIAGKNGCRKIHKTLDGKSVAILFEDGNQLIHFPTQIGIPAYYPLTEVKIPEKISAVLMDLDGTSVKSEHFWIWVIQQVIATLRKEPDFRLEEKDMPHVSGYSVSEHLEYVINKYLAGKNNTRLENARSIYFEIVHRELQNVLEGKPAVEPCFEPAPFLREFLSTLKEKNVKIGLVSSGLHEKAFPEIKDAFSKIDLGDPVKFYDAIITAGFSIKKGQMGTLGELEAKPHPWLYAETLHALNVPGDEVIGIEDSGAGILSLKAAQIPAIGVSGGNIESGGEKSLCNAFFDNLEELLHWMKDKI